MRTRYYDVVVGSKEITYDNYGIRKNIHRFYLSLDELVAYLKKELDGADVDVFDVSRPDSTGKYQCVMIGATTYGEHMAKHWVTFDIEARMADTTLYDEDGKPIPYGVEFDLLDKNDVTAIRDIPAILEYCKKEAPYYCGTF